MRAACQPVVGRWLAKRYGDRIPSRGRVIDTSNSAIAPPLKAMLFWGTYEKPEVLLISRLLRPGIDVIELGSSIGVVSAHIAARLNSTARLICVEANPYLTETVRTNIRLNSRGASSTVVTAAVDYSGEADVTFAVAHHNHLYSRLAATGENLVTVPAITLHELCAQQQIQEFSLVADIEGAELGIISHEGDLLARCQQLIIELHDVEEGQHLISVEQMAHTLIDVHGFSQVRRMGDVFAMQRR